MINPLQKFSKCIFDLVKTNAAFVGGSRTGPPAELQWVPLVSEHPPSQALSSTFLLQYPSDNPHFDWNAPHPLSPFHSGRGVCGSNRDPSGPTRDSGTPSSETTVSSRHRPFAIRLRPERSRTDVRLFWSRRSTYPPAMDQVTENVYVGDRYDATDASALDANDVETVVTLHAGEHDHTTIHHPLADGENDQAAFDAAVDAVRDLMAGDETALVHCAAGVSRSVTVVATAVAATEDLAFDEALKRVEDCHPVANPHPELRNHARTYLEDAT